MQLRLLTTTFLLLAATMVSCTDHTSVQTANPQENPDPPINGGDGDVFVPPIDEIDPVDPLDDGAGSGTPGSGGGNGNNGGGSGQSGGGSGGGGGGGSGQSNGGGGGNGGGGAPGSAVPEPGTMLLVGSGLAGLAYYRRRKGQPEVQSEEI